LIDDLYFREGDPLLHTFRGILDGGIMEFPSQVGLIVTSNHRHLIEEKHSLREDALRSSEIIDETMALADRFGLTISTWEPDMRTYMQIVLWKLLEEKAINSIPSDWESELSIFETTEWELSRSASKTPLSGLFLMAKRFALERGSRSGRTASLFAKMVRRGLLEAWQ
jgi:predicted AAA+ superfamily ATPase